MYLGDFWFSIDSGSLIAELNELFFFYNFPQVFFQSLLDEVK